MASKLDAATSDMKQRLAEQMAEVSRNRNRLLDANGRLQMQSDDIGRLNNEIGRREDKIKALNAQIEENVKAISQAWAKAADHESDAARAFGMHKEAITAINIREDRIRQLEGEAKALREIIAAFLPGKERDIGKELQIAVRHIPQNPSAITRSLLTDVAENVTVLPEPAINSFQARFNVNNPLAPVDALPESLSTPEHVNDEPAMFPREASSAGLLEQGISNVLSLAERVREMQKGTKK